MSRSVLDQLPNRGWGVVRANTALVVGHMLAGHIKAQYTHLDGVFQARLTGAGRRYRDAQVNNPQ